MKNGRQGLKVLGLSLLAALGLTAFAAAGAQAEPNTGKILVENLTAPFSATLVGEVENALEGYLQILNLNLKLTCHQGGASGYLENNNAKKLGHGHVAIEFSGCLVLDKNEKAVACKLIEPIKANALGKVFLHGTTPYIRLTPLDNLTFATVLHKDEFCPLPETANVKGSQVVSLSNPNTDEVTQLISTKNPAGLFPSDTLTYGTNLAHLSADAKVKLSGPHAGLKWGAA